mmetsp:Transcript_33800/g.54137  ORF Transcript_33800/g.54137 Transcript_33800/m.54137 type:complete len:184 (+) Transcript_33800:2-553(+)
MVQTCQVPHRKVDHFIMRFRQCVEDPTMWAPENKSPVEALAIQGANPRRTAFHLASDPGQLENRHRDFLGDWVPKGARLSREEAAHFLAPSRPTAYNFTVEEAAHAAHHSNEEQRALRKAMAKDHSLTAEEAKFFSLLSGPLTFLTSMFAITAAYLEVQNGWMLSQKAKMKKEEIAHAAPRES